MSRRTAKITALVAALAVLATRLVGRAESKPAYRLTAINSSKTTEAKIERAMSAGPPEIARAA